jgi:two-component system OmpR family response regulator
MKLAGACRALVVEDHDPTREGMRRLLRALGHEAEGAGTLAEAMERLGSVGCLFLDLNLSDGSGVQLLRHIRERGLPIRVAVTTASSDERALEEVRQLRPDGLFVKPVDFGDLVRWLKSA